LERYQEALADFTRTIELEPEYAWAVTERGVTYQLL
jgi:lipoprotein NlpI